MGNKVKFVIRFEPEDHDAVKRNAEIAGMTMSSYIRNSLKSAQIMQKPEADVPQLLIEMRRSAESLRKLLEVSYAAPQGYAESIRRALEENRKAEQLVSDAYGMRCP
ncbi:MAG: hypothetical protein IKD87_06395 [Oscillospiraceae bacterium]|nr:hypothetical protein [Oscillospiraceae bacterium]